LIDDFEKYWLVRFSCGLDEVVGVEIRKEIVMGSEGLSDKSDRKAVIDWSKKAIGKLDELVDEEDRIAVMTSCTCQYPKSDLQEIRQKYEETKSTDAVHKMLQDKFLSFLKDRLNLDNEVIGFILDKGMGLAGHKDASTIIATKIPKSGYILEYLKEKDRLKKRALYCHCPRIRDALKTGTEISPTYCYCGAGYYKGIWEEILQRPVKVELLESVLKGDDACKIAIHLSS